jgi:hypothetical protein
MACHSEAAFAEESPGMNGTLNAAGRALSRETLHVISLSAIPSAAEEPALSEAEWDLVFFAVAAALGDCRVLTADCLFSPVPCNLFSTF